jgi:hypothetical protein
MPIYNKLAAITVTLPDWEASRLISRMPRSAELEMAQRALRQDANHVLAEQAYCRRIFTRSFQSYLDKFQIPFNA